MAYIYGTLMDLGIVGPPSLVGFTFLGLVLIMSSSLNRDVMRASELSRRVRRDEQSWERERRDEHAEPPCPPGLGKLSPAVEAFASFLRIDSDLIQAAATASPELGATDDAALTAWVAALPEADKTSILLRLMGGAEAHLRGELLRRFHPELLDRARRR